MSLYYLVSKKKRFDADWVRGVATNFDITSAFKSSFDYLTEEFAEDMVYHKLTDGIPHIYWGLYVDDHEVFQRESGQLWSFFFQLGLARAESLANSAGGILPKHSARRLRRMYGG